MPVAAVVVRRQSRRHRAAVHAVWHVFGMRFGETPRKHDLNCDDTCSPGWTRTSNPSVNSRMLCQLSYRGLPSRGWTSPRIERRL